jgi:hypothetical protein
MLMATTCRFLHSTKHQLHSIWPSAGLAFPQLLIGTCSSHKTHVAFVLLL